MAGLRVSDSDHLPEGLQLAPEVVPRPAASVIVLRNDPFEVLMLRRHEKSSFVPSAWVFPGGVIEPLDGELANDVIPGLELGPARVAAARETFEESGVWLGAPLHDAEQKRERLLGGTLAFREIVAEAPVDFARLVWAARWITPIGIPKRFDTWFFAVEVPRSVVATADRTEAVEAEWFAPADALARHSNGAMKMVFPTVRTLESLARFTSAGDFLDERRNATIETILPVITENGGRKTIVLAG